MAYQFDGVDDKIDWSVSTAINLPDADWTISFKANQPTTNDLSDILWLGQGGSNARMYITSIDWGSGAYMEVFLRSTNGGIVSLASSIGSTWDDDGLWHQVTITRDGDLYTLYTDTTNEDSETDAVPEDFDFDASGTGSAYFGGSGGYSDRFDGMVAEFAIWHRLLDSEEIAALSEGYAPSFFKDELKIYFPCVREYESCRISGTTLTNDGTTIGDHPPMIYPADTPMYHYSQYINAPLESATGTITNTFTLTFTLNGVLQTATLYAPASIYEGFNIAGVLQNATGIYVPSVPWDQTVTAPVITASGQVVAAVQWDQQLAGALLQATGTLDTGVWLIDQNIAGQILSATGILDTQAWSIDSNIAGVYITPTGLIAATFTGEQLYTGDFTFETPDSDSFTIETPGSDSFTEE